VHAVTRRHLARSLADTTVLGPLVAALVVSLGGACEPTADAPEPPRELSPVLDPPAGIDLLRTPQPHRLRPGAIAYDARRDRLWVALQGTESEPGREVVALDRTSLRVRARLEVGPFPVALAIHPAGRHLVVLNRFARYASVIDLEREAVVGEVPTPYYGEALAFTPDGATALVANRWRDALLRWEVRVEGERFVAVPEDDGRSPLGAGGIRTFANPRRVYVMADGGRALATTESELAIASYDLASGREVARHSPNAPVIDAAQVGDFVVILHTGSGTGHPPDHGRDGDGDGAPGDGTANVVFQDLQNEIDVLRASDLALLHRYTSDTLAFRDYRDVDPHRPEAGLELGPPDTWPPERAEFLPPESTWIVAGAMPERVVAFARADGRPAIAVVYGGSSEVQTFDLDPATGALSPRESTGALYPTGMGAMDAVVTGRTLVVVDRLGEGLSVLDLDDPGVRIDEVVVGDVSAGAFPATDAELGEAFNTMTASFTVDGDQTCVHCHRDGSPVGKDVSMPLLVDPVFGTRLIMSYRGASDTRPWFFEAGMDESNFFPVINELARRENFCCEQVDTRVWGALPARAACEADPAREGCSHVLHCEEDPPPACAERRYGSPHLVRDRHFREAARALFGRDTTFGDVLYTERVGLDGSIEHRPIPLGFDGITRSLGVFLMTRTRLLPNPNAAMPSADARRGALLYASSETGCTTCHPLPTGATGGDSVLTTPIGVPFVVSPLRHPETLVDVDRITNGLLGTFPRVRQDEVGLHIGVTSVRGSWDRVRFLHAGTARSMREVLATPGHGGLAPGEVGRNERDGFPNTHGGTSHLDAQELAALAAFVETL
jgi:hypothetical protein